MSRRAQIIGYATDALGNRWDVREARPTGREWLVLIGWPQGEPRGRGCGGPRVIITVELARYLTNTRLRDAILPIGNTVIKKLRAKLGIHWSWDAWWRDRYADLMSMTIEDFCRQHGCSMGAASQRRRKALAGEQLGANLDTHAADSD